MQCINWTNPGGGLCYMDRCYKWQYLYKVLGKCFTGYIYRNIVQYCTWYNHSIRIRCNTHRHTGTCILSACFISRSAIFSRSGPHGRGDCLAPFSAPCASLSFFLKRTVTITQAGALSQTLRSGTVAFNLSLRHWCRVYICISKGDYRKVSCLGEDNMQGTSPPWVNKQRNYRICL